MADNYIDLPGHGAVSWKHSVATLATLPATGNSTGDARVVRDTATVYVWDGAAWVSAGGGGGSGTVTSVGLAAPGIFTVSGSPVTTAGTLTLALATESANIVFAGPASGGAATPTFRALVAADIAALTGNLTDAGTDGITVTGGTGAVFGSGTSLAQHVADSTHNGYLSSTDWTTFNSKQAAGNYITALTGDVTASGPGSAAATVAKIQGTTVSGTTGTVNVVFSNSPVLTTPNIGSATGSITGHAALDLALAGGNMSGTIDMGSNKITSVTDPTAAQDAATKSYVDAAVAALNPQEAVYAASTANIAGTYLNGAAGIGATFTVTATGAFSIDGVSPPINSRILIKNQTSGFQNGIYNLTVVGTTGVSPILTRSVNYNTPSEMNNGGLIPVINGTANALSSWQQVATITTVGTDSLVFTEFTANPSLYLLKANNLSDVSNSITAFNNISPMTTLGDVIYGGSSGTGTRLAGNTTSTNKFLTQTGNGTISATPGWNTIASADLPTITLTSDVTGVASGGSVATTVAKIAGTTVSGTTGTGNVVFSASPTLTGTITAAAANFSGAISASNLSGTNTGNVTIGTANGLSLSTQVLSLALSSTSTTGALSSTDWNTFNNKQGTITTGNLTDAGTDGIVVTGGTGAVVGSGTSLSQHVADTTHNGYLSSTDWNTFNGKQASGNYITALTGDVTASGPGSSAATVAKIQGTTVSGTTGTTNVVFSGSPTIATPTITTSIVAPLLIGGTGTTSPLAIRSTSGVGAAGADIIFQTGNNGASEDMRILNSGFVGIGTASPTRRLTLVASAIGDGILIVGNPSGTLSPQIAFSDGTNEEAAFGLALANSAYSNIALVNDFVLRTDAAPSNGNLILSNQNNTSIKFATGTAGNTDTLKMILTAAGALGIGTASPGSLLDVKGTLRLSGATSGFVGLAPASAAGGTTYTLPSADGSSGQALSTNGSGTLTWNTVVASVSYPTQATIWQGESTITVGTGFLTNGAGGQWYTEFYQSTPANGNAFQNVFFLKAGTYTLSVLGSTNNDRGIIDWAVDGSTVLAGQDWYGGAAVNVTKTGSVTIATDGNHTITGTVNGKNGSSANYYIAIEKYWIR